MTKEPTKAQLREQHAAAMADLHGALTEALKERDSGINRAAMANIKLAEAEKALAAEVTAHNVTRDVLHSTELELAKTRGYLDAKQDAEPPVMVPLQREGHIASYHDGTRSVSAGWRNEGYGQTPNKPWWHR